MKNFHLLIVVNESERELALTNGWDPRDVVLPARRVLEGRRFSTCTITWMALFEMLEEKEEDVLGAIYRAAVLQQNAEVKIGHPTAPPKE